MRRYYNNFGWFLRNQCKLKETLIELQQAHRQMAAEHLLVISRLYLGKELEDKLQQLSYTLENFLKDLCYCYNESYYLQNGLKTAFTLILFSNEAYCTRRCLCRMTFSSCDKTVQGKLNHVIFCEHYTTVACYICFIMIAQSRVLIWN